ncbi:MAG: hypothetical protein HQK61_07470, partial [Desulfamplus sp.]|nr:hypothetical protein [Desulfamplus sp.]
LGYRQVTLRQDSVLGNKGDMLRGHEFHYSSLEHENNMEHDQLNRKEIGQNEVKLIYNTEGRDGHEISLNGYQIDNTLGSYLHVHFESMAGGSAKAFVDACLSFALQLSEKKEGYII